ncbi:MAG: transcription elongation factor subunit Spt4 [Nitrososphaerota archaeon]|nr:transcription elongation factor subunit Spt4 [Nitrososphaerota archaeon]
MARERACRSCKAITSGEKCGVCGSTNLSFQYSGLIIMIDPERSEISKILGISSQGRYALRVE